MIISFECKSVIFLLLTGFTSAFNLTIAAEILNSPSHLASKIKILLENEVLENISSTCRAHLITYVDSLRRLEPWALEMFDAWAKVPSGLASINLVEFGSFDECLGVRAVTNVGTINGQYCLGSLPINGTKDTVSVGIIGRPTYPDPEGRLTLSLGVCIPDSCTIKDVTYLYKNLTGLSMNFYEKLCQSSLTQVEMGGAAYGTLAFFCIVIALMTISTLYDSYLYYFAKAPAHPALVAFSAVANIKKLITPSNPKGQITCLYGIRIFVMMWAVIVHRYQIISDSPVANRLELTTMLTEPIYMYIYTSPVRVDTFLLLAGLMVCYNFMNSYKKGLKFNIFLYYSHRYIRLTPVYAAAVLFYANLMEHLGSGPIWKTAAVTQAQNCKSYWWSALLYVQNYVNSSEVCILPTWNLSVDTQLFLLSPLLLFPMKKWPKIMLSITGFLVVCTAIGSFVTAYFADFKVLGIVNKGGLAAEYRRVYFYPTHIRAGAWLIGTIVGYYIHKHYSGQITFRLNRMLVFFLWVCTIALLATCIFGAHNLLLHQDVQTEQAIYAGAVHLVWNTGVGWIIFACATGHGGFINKVLSSQLFEISSRLTYAVSISHWFALIITTHQMRKSFIINDLTAMHMFWGDVSLSAILALILILGFELPMITFERLAIAPFEKKSKKADTPG